MIEVKSATELEIIRNNATILGQILGRVVDKAEPGVTTVYLDGIAEDEIRSAGAIPAFKGYRGFPNSLCTSINNEIVHGIPAERQLKEGDIISLDVGLKKDGYFADVATTVEMGEADSKTHEVIVTADKALTKGIEQVKVGNRISDISHAIESYVSSQGFHVVKEFVGHGIGRELHEDPQITNYGEPGQGQRLTEGMVFAIEPMVKIDDKPVKVLDDGWTAVTADGGVSAHFEGMVLVTDDEPEVFVRGGGQTR